MWYPPPKGVQLSFYTRKCLYVKDFSCFSFAPVGYSGITPFDAS